MQHGKVAKSKDSVRIREDIKVHDGCLQPNYCSIQQLCIAFLIYVSCSWLLNMRAIANEF